MTGPSRYFFVHLQKTAGTALLNRIRNHFGPEVVYPRPHEQGTPDSVLDTDLVRRRVQQAEPAILVVTGHFPLATADLLGGPVSTFTVLRDPVERVLSFLRHQREVAPNFAGLGLEEIYAQPISTGPLVRNHMTRMLSLRADEMTQGALTPVEMDEHRLGSAVDALRRIDVVGLQDHFDTFCADLAARFGWDLGDPLFMNRTPPSDAPDRLRARIAEDNAIDVQLHTAAVDLWRQRHPDSGTGHT